MAGPESNMTPMAYTELHFHLLPGVDDGPATLDASVELAAAAAEEGTRTILATPHVHPAHVQDVRILPEIVEAVQARLRAERIPIEVLCGGELSHHMVGRLRQADFERIAAGPPGGRWLLLEASLSGLDEAFTEAADELRARGFGILVAHPERALLGRDPGWTVLENELALGSAVQVNAWSVAGLYGQGVQEDALRVLGMARTAVIASDAHGSARMPALSLGLAALEHTGDRQRGRRIGALPHRLLHTGLEVVEPSIIG